MTRYIAIGLTAFICLSCMLAIFAYPNKPFFSIKHFVIWNVEWVVENFPTMDDLNVKFEELEYLQDEGGFEGMLAFFQEVGITIGWIAKVIWFFINWVLRFWAEFFYEGWLILFTGTNVV